jgi:hypothetical protein
MVDQDRLQPWLDPQRWDGERFVRVHPRPGLGGDSGGVQRDAGDERRSDSPGDGGAVTGADPGCDGQHPGVPGGTGDAGPALRGGDSGPADGDGGAGVPTGDGTEDAVPLAE